MTMSVAEARAKGREVLKIWPPTEYVGTFAARMGFDALSNLLDALDREEADGDVCSCAVGGDCDLMVCRCGTGGGRPHHHEKRGGEDHVFAAAERLAAGFDETATEERL